MMLKMTLMMCRFLVDDVKDANFEPPNFVFGHQPGSQAGGHHVTSTGIIRLKIFGTGHSNDDSDDNY